MPADRSAQALAELRPRRPAEGHREMRQPVDRRWGPPCPGSDELGQALGAEPHMQSRTALGDCRRFVSQVARHGVARGDFL
jgi:hypothetical protein